MCFSSRLLTSTKYKLTFNNLVIMLKNIPLKTGLLLNVKCDLFCVSKHNVFIAIRYIQGNAPVRHVTIHKHNTYNSYNTTMVKCYVRIKLI